MTRRYWNINLEEMMEAGVHFGHGTRKWNPRMAPYISAKRKGIHITNLTRTARFLSEACDLVFDAASRGKQFLIVGTKAKAADSVARAALRARCHYVNKKWLGGPNNYSCSPTHAVPRLLCQYGSNSEKTAPPNLSVRGYDIIDAAKSAVEAVCPGVVSCADIIAMATRDAVFLSGGGRYNVQTGRRDGLVSLATNVNLPAPSISVSDSINAFANKGLTAIDMVYLLGGHTVGVAHCSLFQDRLYNFQNTGKPDPSMNPLLLNFLKFKCPQNATVDNTANLDQNPPSSLIVDKSYYRQILLDKGILQIDQELASDPLSQPTVTTIANSYDFCTRFGQAMVKLGAVQVLTGTQGEIRKSCHAVN
ncbi:hypothetical protein F0562_022273 [Nyssa sinensis]|uniref:Peroxidase n=1 Tax=Nyssa sinensis TaxID=561372 RepID=A0A5J5BSQ7_9ASTE|nr:hypothetical protein F0562_022273 [Nyssa sinensis]